MPNPENPTNVAPATETYEQGVVRQHFETAKTTLSSLTESHTKAKQELQEIQTRIDKLQQEIFYWRGRISAYQELWNAMSESVPSSTPVVAEPAEGDTDGGQN